MTEFRKQVHYEIQHYIFGEGCFDILWRNMDPKLFTFNYMKKTSKIHLAVYRKATRFVVTLIQTTKLENPFCEKKF